MKKVGPPRFWVYALMRGVLFIGYKICFSLRSYGTEHVPPDSDPRGVILAPNHASFLDPPILGVTLGRPVTYLAKEYLFKKPVVGWALESCGALPISSGAEDFRTIREIVRGVKNGACVVIFPEGTRSVDGELKAGESGIGFVAMKSAAWVVPTYIEGTFEAFPRGQKMFKCRPVKVHYGEPFVPAQDEAILKAQDPYAAVSARIMVEIKKLKDAAAKK
jgi:1-acyl-sn-glycerol-3-phosphate acyltransferase